MYKRILFILCLLHTSVVISQLNATFDQTLNTVCNGSPCDYEGPSILINELMISPVSNDGSMAGPGPDGGRAEWIELYNPDLCEPVDISCYYLGNYTFEGAGGFVIPPGTVVPPTGFAMVRGSTAAPVPANLLVQNGGNVVEIVVPPEITDPGVCSGGGRLWFPNLGGWFAFYNENGVPQDAVRWGPGNQGDINQGPCVAQRAGCANAGALASYSNIPNERKEYVSSLNGNDHLGSSIRRIPDGGDWDGVGNPTYADCNASCIPEGVSSCTGTATVNPTGGTPPYTFQWNDQESQTTQTATALCGETYTVEVTDANGTSESFEVTIDDFEPTVTLDIAQEVCLNESPFDINFGATPQNSAEGQGEFSGTGVSGTNFIPGQAGIGTHEITYTYTDTNECFSSDTDEITVLELPELAVDNNLSPYCVSEPTTDFQFTPAGGTLFGNGVTNNQLIPQDAGVGNHPLFYTYTDPQGCTDTINFEVEVVGLPNLSTNIPSQFCLNDEPLLMEGTPGGGVFELNGTVETTIDPSSLGVGVNDVIYTAVDGNGCENIIEESFEIFPIPEVLFDPDFQESCPPLTTTFNAESSPVVSCLWDFGDGTTSNSCGTASHTYTSSGCYDVSYEVTSAQGCKNKATSEDIICIFKVPVAGFSFLPDPVTQFFTEVFFQNSTLFATEYEWFFEGGDLNYSTDASPVVNYPEGVVDDYEVLLVATSEGGCTDSVRRVVSVESEILLYVPNSFTPDGDKHNESWKPVIEGIDIFDYHLIVYNRWGEIVWESRNPDVAWDGYYRNNKVKSGTYVWTLEARDSYTSERKKWEGHVNVLY